MSIRKTRKFIIAAGACVCMASQAYGSSFLNTFWTSIFSPVKVSKVDDLQFGTIAPDLLTSGVVSVNSGSDNSSTCGTALTCIEGGDRAQFAVTGRLLQLINLEVSDTINLSNSAGDTMLVDNFDLDAAYNGGWFALLIGAGSIDVGVGADLHVGANQAVGDYTGTFVLTANYQ